MKNKEYLFLILKAIKLIKTKESHLKRFNAACKLNLLGCD